MYRSETLRRFFVKLHRARSLHFDFRLEHAGVLKSWVLPDGLCWDPVESRRTIAVPDHQVRYGSVERVIPVGQYGAGPMLLWDYGTWLPCHDVDQGLRDGHLMFHLQGSRLNGLWLLERTPVRGGVRGKNWRLKKEPDAEAWTVSNRNIFAEMPTSVLTGRTLDEVAAAPRRVVSLRSNGSHRNQRLLPFV